MVKIVITCDGQTCQVGAGDEELQEIKSTLGEIKTQIEEALDNPDRTQTSLELTLGSIRSQIEELID
jgi:hypothetical protein